MNAKASTFIPRSHMAGFDHAARNCRARIRERISNVNPASLQVLGFTSAVVQSWVQTLTGQKDAQMDPRHTEAVRRIAAMFRRADPRMALTVICLVEEAVVALDKLRSGDPESALGMMSMLQEHRTQANFSNMALHVRERQAAPRPALREPLAHTMGQSHGQSSQSHGQGPQSHGQGPQNLGQTLSPGVTHVVTSQGVDLAGAATSALASPGLGPIGSPKPTSGNSRLPSIDMSNSMLAAWLDSTLMTEAPSEEDQLPALPGQEPPAPEADTAQLPMPAGWTPNTGLQKQQPPPEQTNGASSIPIAEENVIAISMADVISLYN